ncbi:GNAT family N-acetyltransferase [Aerolutibacter daejeonensis]|uniref:GNAT family N-acetyltransferase n=1 Tax=Aerolutibacter daejeonensis TaxID=346181 RepID=UPI0006908D8D|nr:GNAT family N-acetyltransferase [Lysobacter daejeonensis]
MPDATQPESQCNPPALPVLDAGSVRLRPHRENDLQDFFALYSDPQVMRYWSFPAWTHVDQARERFTGALAGHDPSRLLCWAMADADSDRLIGGVTLFAINVEQGRAEIGYALHSSQWGRGHARGALGKVLEHAFGPLGLRRVEADIDPRNAASCRLVERLGFAREGLLRERWCVGGDLQDSAMYGLLARDWLAAPR